MGSTSVASVAASGVLLAASGVVCDSSLFSLEIAVSTKLLTSDSARTKTSVSLIKQVALVGNNTKRSACKAGLLMLRMSVKLTRVTRVVLPNNLYEAVCSHRWWEGSVELPINWYMRGSCMDRTLIYLMQECLVITWPICKVLTIDTPELTHSDSHIFL